MRQAAVQAGRNMLYLWGERCSVEETTMESPWGGMANRTMRAFHLPSLVVGVWKDGQEQYFAKGRRGSLVGGVNRDTVYPIASASKSFIATAVCMLAQEGRLELDAPVVRYLPDFAMYTPEMTAALTVRDTLCHCCGLPRHDVTLITCENLTLEEMVRRVRYLQPAWPMHARFCYQNHMFAVASLLVQRVAGMPWGQFVRQRIFAPLGMGRSHTGSFEYRAADGNYARPRANLKGLNLPMRAMNTDSTGAAGSINASVRDLLQWVKVHLGSGLTEDGKQLFTAETAGLLHGCQTAIGPGQMLPYSLGEVSEPHYGLGWFVERFRGEKLVHHGGTLNGYKSLMGFMPRQGFAFAILCNLNGTQACNALGYALCDWALGRQGTDWDGRFLGIAAERAAVAKANYRKNTAPPQAAPNPAGCAGRYTNGAYGTLAVTQKGGGLRLALEEVQGGARLVPSAEDEFAIAIPLAGMAMPCRFERENGRAVRFLARLEPDLEDYVPFQRVE